MVFYNLKDAKEIKERLAITDTIGIIGEPMVCAELVQIPMLKDKEVKIISKVKPDSFLPGPKQEWIEGLELSEIIGEGCELQAIKLNNGKVIGVSLVIFSGIQLPASDFLKGGDIKTENGYILVNEAMATNLENVLACGSVSKKSKSFLSAKTWDDAVKDGILAANNLLKIGERGNNLCQPTS